MIKWHRTPLILWVRGGYYMCIRQISYESLPTSTEHSWVTTRSTTSGIITSPTGSGKTLTFITDSRRFLTPGNVVVIVGPQLPCCCNQLFDEFDKHLSDIDFMWRQVSSEGKTFKRARTNLKFRVTPPNHQQQLLMTFVTHIELLLRSTRD